MSATAEAAPGLRRVEDVMGMPVYVDLRDDRPDPEVVEAMYDWLRWVDATFSTYKPDSEIMRLARGELRLGDAHSHVRYVLDRCESLQAETDGYFDAFSGGGLDPSGLVKGWSVDHAAAILEAGGLRNFAVNAGGDIRLRGAALPEDRWSVGIQHPRERDKVAAVVEGTDLAVATSGSYARGDHVLDPHTRRPPRGILSVTITGPDLATADAYATAAFAMGPEGVSWSAQLPGYEAMTILESEQVLATLGFPST